MQDENMLRYSEKTESYFVVRQTAAISANFLFLFLSASVARTEWLQIASQSVTQSEGTISRETIVTVESPEPPPKPKSEVKSKNELKPESAVKPEGQWSVQVRASQIQSDSLGLAKKLKAKGYDTEVVEAQIQGRTWYRVHVGHFVTKQEAQALLNTLKSKEGLSGAFLVGP